MHRINSQRVFKLSLRTTLVLFLFAGPISAVIVTQVLHKWSATRVSKGSPPGGAVAHGDFLVMQRLSRALESEGIFTVLNGSIVCRLACPFEDYQVVLAVIKREVESSDEYSGCAVWDEFQWLTFDGKEWGREFRELDEFFGSPMK
ncbi:MAG: hypothetical protein KDB14_23920 [Planctomycetales bacterium]|nr:hypothetical protein [Planctomycetales bacterium]